MQSKSLQEMVKKIFSDEKTKSEFLSSPESVIGRYDLTDQERKAVLATHARLGLVASSSGELAARIENEATWAAPQP